MSRDPGHATFARSWATGQCLVMGGRFEWIDNLTSTGLYTHYSINKDGSVNYVNDSAASGSASSTGIKTYNGAIGVDSAGRPERHLIEIAKNAGLCIGNLTTVEIQGATPAVSGAHASTRSCYAPSGAKSDCDADLALHSAPIAIARDQHVRTARSGPGCTALACQDVPLSMVLKHRSRREREGPHAPVAGECGPSPLSWAETCPPSLVRTPRVRQPFRSAHRLLQPAARQGPAH